MSDTHKQDWEREVRTVWEATHGLSDEEVVAAIDAMADLRPDADAAAFYERASARHHGRALSTALTALAPHLPAYDRAVLHYAADVSQ